MTKVEKYIVTVRGQVPADISERISKAHARLLQSHTPSPPTPDLHPETSREIPDGEQESQKG